MKTDIRERRRNYYIKKEFQRNFILKFCTLIIMGSIISGVIIYAMSRATVTTTFEHSRLAIKSTADFILPAVLLSSAIVIVSIGIATIVMTLFTSHRIAGPLYRMEKDVQEVTAGNLKIRFNLRQGDELKPLAASLDAMAQTLRIKLMDIKSAVYNLENVIGSQSGEIKEKLRMLKSAAEKFNT